MGRRLKHIPPRMTQPQRGYLRGLAGNHLQPEPLQPIRRAPHSQRPTIDHMRVNHGRPDVRMP